MKAFRLVVVVVAAVSLLENVTAIPASKRTVAAPDSHLLERESLSLIDEESPSCIHEKLVASQPHRRHSSKHKKRVSSKTIFITSMAFITGCVDTICYRRYKCYVNMMTGNTIQFAAALAESRWSDAVFHVSLICNYIVGVGIVRAMDLHLRHGDQSTESSHQLLIVVAPVIVSLFVMADIVSHFHANHRIHAPLLSIGFGIMNAALADATGGTILYAMTGHFTKIGRNVVDYWMLPKPKAFKSLKFHLRIVIFFATGIALSIKASQYMLPLGFRLPMATTVGMAFAALFVWYGGVSQSHSVIS